MTTKTKAGAAGQAAALPDVRKALEVIGQALANVPATRLEAVAGVLNLWIKEHSEAVYLDVLTTLLTGQPVEQQHSKAARVYTFKRGMQ